MATADERFDEAIAVQQAGNLEGAVAKLQAILTDEPDFPLAHCALSVFYGKLGRHEEAVRHAERLCQIQPEDPFNFISLSIVHQKAGQTAEAEAAMAQALEKQWAGRK